MSQFTAALSSLTRLSASSEITSVSDNESVTVHDRNFNNQVSNAFNTISDTASQFRSAINSLSGPNFTGDPDQLIQLQAYIGEYSNYVSLVSTLARKGVSTIETLEKSQ